MGEAAMRDGIKREIQGVNRHAGGATLTKVARETALAHVFAVWQRELNIQVKSLASVKTGHVAAYVRYALDSGKSLRSIQNDLTHLRMGLRAVHRDEFASSKALSNAALGVGGACRDGSHRALSVAQYEAVLGLARSRDAGFAACVTLQRELGLRSREAVLSVPSLRRWEQALLRGKRVRVIHGT